jgi:hypothetical protein
MDISQIAAIVAAVFGTTGLLGGGLALAKFRGESTAVLIGASGEVVIMQKGMIAELREELAVTRREHAEEVARCRSRADELERELESVRRDVQRSHSRHNTQDQIIAEMQRVMGPGGYHRPGIVPGQEPENPPIPPIPPPDGG